MHYAPCFVIPRGLSTLYKTAKQKWKSTFLSCPGHKIYRVEAVGLKSSNDTFKITSFVSVLNLGQFREKLIFCQ